MIFSCIAMLMAEGSDAVIGGDLFILQSSCDDSGIISGHGVGVLTCVGTRGHKNRAAHAEHLCRTRKQHIKGCSLNTWLGLCLLKLITSDI